ncbi:hypothetical protein [Aneurinibacillus aneurinilyticus]|jgi:uncharacterized protein (UPF0335 family)|uniref:Uncharacterized protein n=1 Tax=Aneurinibacillus aneurinilyticus ATCC 12856 TaxID=649747 RepID=U1WIS3_ANEAE|nr:hypothetical protein [Aneurinibacillus aneurinilyticus]ERI08484.1 hypothetical protein HMPREF0083_03434 [Aneurinibacillus aneurinilyticus ATCC 12856]MED0668967.1 hypothetical protein [Aneurinibacillus aneurinilyticus]MED0707254.1 hypothetical protein [Aneurinibacillus aneurinilyticus]MED0726090.1 hypothetical protein [Aneurinibacillus aneurinilyticus]MED0733520.1 hypothetical protein [Aneurinibacillus aneurinilyticus]
MNNKLETFIENLNRLEDEKERKHQAMHLLLAAIVNEPMEH